MQRRSENMIHMIPTLHVVCESVGHRLHYGAHGHVTPLKHLLHNQLPRVPVEGLGGVYVARIAQDSQDPLAAGSVLHRTPRSFATDGEGAGTVSHQHTQRLLHLENRRKGTTVVLA